MAVFRTTLIILALLLGWFAVRHDGYARASTLPVAASIR